MTATDRQECFVVIVNYNLKTCWDCFLWATCGCGLRLSYVFISRHRKCGRLVCRPEVPCPLWSIVRRYHAAGSLRGRQEASADADWKQNNAITNSIRSSQSITIECQWVTYFGRDKDRTCLEGLISNLRSGLYFILHYEWAQWNRDEDTQANTFPNWYIPKYINVTMYKV